MKFKSLYTISPTILTDTLPNRSSIEYIISQYFHLFNIYSDNLYVVKDYMDFINVNFEFAFYKLGYEIIGYDYPENLEAPTDIIDYINNKYDLRYQSKLSIYYRVNSYSVNDIMTGSSFIIYLNDYALYDSKFMSADLYDTQDTLYSLGIMINYLLDKDMVNVLGRLIVAVSVYDSAISDVMNDIPDVYTSGMVSEPLLSFWQLKRFVYGLKGEENE